MPTTQQFRQEVESVKKRKSQTVNDRSLQQAHTNSSYNILLHALIERVKETTCSQCELTCGDNITRVGYNDLPTFYCENFCNAYFAEVDALDLGLPVERELWARSRMWKAHLLHTPLSIEGGMNGAIFGERRRIHDLPY
ncbi:MAG: hypothetical protein ACXVJJ_04165 [Halobacteriota archaeon]